LFGFENLIKGINFNLPEIANVKKQQYPCHLNGIEAAAFCLLVVSYLQQISWQKLQRRARLNRPIGTGIAFQSKIIQINSVFNPILAKAK